MDKEGQRVILENGEITYDYLVIALGFESNTFGIKGMDKYAYAIVDIDSSRLIREHIELQFAKYRNEENPDDSLLTILVGGAGFTGIEFVGELVEKVHSYVRSTILIVTKLELLTLKQCHLFYRCLIKI